ncbi:hypothetical protein KJ586_03340 [Patescibacteria group bacterium]|nr:hypothetical protein [Patescibacteria group bacterium]MBU4346964.1 hypothetical protein [Patescibacteria group bacterium]MBU4455517.1 hypothetical protein [Patescibacteria group bacterium]
MGIRNERKKHARKKEKLPILSSSGQESWHYIGRCVERSGFFKPISKKSLKRRIREGDLSRKKLSARKILLTNRKTGEKIIVNNNLKGGITYIK